MTTTTTLAPGSELDTIEALRTCASLLRLVAALGGAVDADRISITIGGYISVQVAQDRGSDAERVAAVATYADVLGTVVTREGKWVKARGVRSGHEVQVWTIVEPEPAEAGTEVV
jgi:hypothetical protein